MEEDCRPRLIAEAKCEIFKRKVADMVYYIAQDKAKIKELEGTIQNLKNSISDREKEMSELEI